LSEASRATGRRPRGGRIGTVVSGKWTIDARIGSGGMATVYAATHRNGHRVAIKVLHPQLSRDEATRARFLREGYVANAVGHPGVVHVEDDGLMDDGAAFLVLDLLEGDTVEARRHRVGGAMPVDEVLEIADQALDALGAAHDKGIIHRDLKPENLFVCNGGDVKILDFGLARMKSTQTETTKTGVTIGTPAFMPPEQARGSRDDVDARSDVWGLGATLFTALTGTFVHDAETLHEQLVANATKRAPSVRELAPHVSAAVAVVIDRALELEKADRWASAGEMQRALRAARAPRPDSGEFLLDSLTMPAASLRHGAPVPSSVSRGAQTPRVPVPSSGHTLQLSPPSSDPTIEEKAPATQVDLLMLLDALPSSDGPFSPKPITERITGTAALQAESQQRQRARETEPSFAAPRAEVTYGSTLQSPSGPALAIAPLSPTLASATGSGPYAAISSGPGEAGVTARGSGSLLPPGVHPIGPATPSSVHPHPSGSPGSHASDAAPGPASLRQHRSARAVVAFSFALIALCAASAAWVLLHR
jgi:eukaryotic-like serine/threonine-protein kinase